MTNSKFSMNSPRKSFPQTIDLAFGPLLLDDLLSGSASPDWRFIATMPFGETREGTVILSIYEEKLGDGLYPWKANAVLHASGQSYLIPDLSYSFLEDHAEKTTTLVNVMNQPLTSQSGYKFLGSLELNGNGPGRTLYVLENEHNGELLTFERWGTPKVIDLDMDGENELVIAFEGLHMHSPDVQIVRERAAGLEINESILETVRHDQGDTAMIVTEGAQTYIRLSHGVKDEGPVQDYFYDKGVLKR